MTKEDKQTIEGFLTLFKLKLDTMKSTSEKREACNKYLSQLKNTADSILSEPLNVNSEEVQEVVAEFTVSASEAMAFEAEGYHPWVDSHKKDINFKFYKRFEDYLLKVKNWPISNILSLDKTTTTILDHIGNPMGKDPFIKKGMVMGDIQSGKTANYTALINKSLDVGYKIIIVLAGMTRDLRNQTQNRLDFEVTGLKKSKSLNHGSSNVGVGLINSNLHIIPITYIDSRGQYGELKNFFNQHPFYHNMDPVLAIVKKNASVLDNLHNFLMTENDDAYIYSDDRTKKILHLPVLMIDDEADQASVDTKNANSEKDASRINRSIRKIIDSCNHISYVGYTATPFANIFISPDIDSDLYPKDFIIAIPTPKDYCGIKEFFGVDDPREIDEGKNENIEFGSRDLVVNIDKDKNTWAGKDANSKSSPITALPDTLIEAIYSFIISCAIKKQRGLQGFNSMLINISMLKNKANTLRPLVESFIDELVGKIKFEFDNEIELFKKLYEDDFEQISKDRLGTAFKDKWENISKEIEPTIISIRDHIKVLNGDSADSLDYSEEKAGDFIILGGNKLSRGLTLEGLTTAYYFRNSKAYDSLLQMGRWFGYKTGWLDVCRVFTTTEYLNNFLNVGNAIERFKKDLSYMAEEHLNPRQVGQRIMYSPNLIPTSRNKMRNAQFAKISFSGSLQQVLNFDPRYIQSNFDLLKDFIDKLGQGEVRKDGRIVFKNIKPEMVIDYLRNYREVDFDLDTSQISIKNWINYISKLNAEGELINWTIALSSNDSPRSAKPVNINSYKIYKPERTLRNFEDDYKDSIYRTKVMTNPRDFREFFSPTDPIYKTIESYNSNKNYPGFDSKNALMVIYVVDIYKPEKIGFDFNTNKDIGRKGDLVEEGQNASAPAIWFPKTKDFEKSATNFYVNHDYKRIHSEDNIEYEDED